MHVFTMHDVRNSADPGTEQNLDIFMVFMSRDNLLLCILNEILELFYENKFNDVLRLWVESIKWAQFKVGLACWLTDWLTLCSVLLNLSKPRSWTHLNIVCTQLRKYSIIQSSALYFWNLVLCISGVRQKRHVPSNWIPSLTPI